MSDPTPASTVPVSGLVAMACAWCGTGYLPTAEGAAELVAVKPANEWVAAAVRIAVSAGWYRRADGQMLCRSHAHLGDGEPRRQVSSLYPRRSPPAATSRSSNAAPAPPTWFTSQRRHTRT